VGIRGQILSQVRGERRPNLERRRWRRLRGAVGVERRGDRGIAHVGMIEVLAPRTLLQMSVRRERLSSTIANTGSSPPALRRGGGVAAVSK